MKVTYSVKHYPAKHICFQYGNLTEYVAYAEAAPLVERGTEISWREVQNLPSVIEMNFEQQRKRDSLADWAGEYAAAKSFPIGGR